jgi:hypothetical protein
VRWHVLKEEVFNHDQILATIGIEPGKPFNPPVKYRAAMERAVVDAYFYMQDRLLKVQANNLFWLDRHYTNFFILDPQGGVVWDEPNRLFYDNRADMYHPGTYYPKKMPPKPATAYMCGLWDSKGRPLDAKRNYKLHVPADMPVSQFWALIIYDFATWAFIYNPLQRVGLSSYDKSTMKMSPDGSVDIYFGPQAPKGLESNWIPTQGKRPAPVMRFYGGTDELWNKTFKLPDVELTT